MKYHFRMILKIILKKEGTSSKLQAPSSKPQAHFCAQPVIALFLLLTTIPSHRPSIMDNPGDVKKFICIKVK
jgi:hypothetical protein